MDTGVFFLFCLVERHGGDINGGLLMPVVTEKTRREYSLSQSTREIQDE
jgi:hypothetical protein